jgi:glycerol-3-phosphate dehydrogenase
MAQADQARLDGNNSIMISRSPDDASRRTWDVVIVGGGILGVCHALEATRRKLSVLLLERDDFGGATSWASHRIVHGGLRYIQSLDFARHHESWRERRWFLAHFPDLVRPLPCLMPLYNVGLKRTDMMRAAFFLNDVLSSGRNDQLDDRHRIPAGRILSAKETREWFPDVESAGLRGGALWHDAMLICPQRVLMELLRWTCVGGGTALNYTAVTSIQRESPSVFCVRTHDRVSDSEREFRARNVINCAGSWAAQLHTETPGSGFAGPPFSLAFSIVLDRPPLSKAAVAVSPRQRGKPMYFLVPFQGKMLAGTAHVAWSGPDQKGRPTEQQIELLVRDLNDAVPGLNAAACDVLRTFSGLLPAIRTGSSATYDRPIRRIHPSSTAHSRFLSVWGVKYTTARSTAERTMRLLFPDCSTTELSQPEPVRGLDWSQWLPPSNSERTRRKEILARIIQNEAVVTLGDLLYRRTDWGTLPQAAVDARLEIASLFDLDTDDAINALASPSALAS